MKKINIILIFSISYFFFSCNDEKKQSKKEVIRPVNSLKPVSQKIIKTTSIDTVAITKDLIKNYSTDKKALSTNTEPNNTQSKIINSQIAAEKMLPNIKKQANESLMTFQNLRKIFSGSKIGQTLTQKQLIQNFEIPEEAVKLVKSITKTAEDEIAVKWQSTWLVEKVSDAELKDGRMKVKFAANKLYTSGKAIGIKYNRKIYNELVIIGHSAYIPSVKGYHWQIGK